MRYADDANIYVRTQRAGQRVMASGGGHRAAAEAKVNEAKRGATAGPTLSGLQSAARTAAGGSGGGVVDANERTHRGQAARADAEELGRVDATCLNRINVYTAGWMGFLESAPSRSKGISKRWTRCAKAAAALESGKQTQTKYREKADGVGDQVQAGASRGVHGTQILVGTEPYARCGDGLEELPVGGTRAADTGAQVQVAFTHGRPCGAANELAGDSRGHLDQPQGVTNLRLRRAVCEQHKYGSVRGALRDGGPYSIFKDRTDLPPACRPTDRSGLPCPCAPAMPHPRAHNPAPRRRQPSGSSPQT